jgi:hypothetical protein
LKSEASRWFDETVWRTRRRRLFEKRKRRRDQTFANTAAHLNNEACARNISIVFVGYPWGIAHEKPGKGSARG